MESGEKKERKKKKKTTRTRSGRRWWSVESIFHTRNLLARDEEKRRFDARRRRRPGRRGGGDCCTGRDSKRRSPSVSLTKFPTARDTEGSTFFAGERNFLRTIRRDLHTRVISLRLSALLLAARQPVFSLPHANAVFLHLRIAFLARSWLASPMKNAPASYVHRREVRESVQGTRFSRRLASVERSTGGRSVARLE